MRRALILAAGFSLLSGCGGGGRSSAPSIPAASNVPASSYVSLTLPADPNGSMIAGISDQLIVGSMTTAIASVPITVTFNPTSPSTTASALMAPRSQASSVAAGAQAQSAQIWKDGPGTATLLRAVIPTLEPVGTRTTESKRTIESLPSTVGSQATFWIQNFQAGIAGVTFEQVPETLAVRTTHANVWVQTSLTSLLGNQSALNTIAANIETAIASDAAHFGSATWTPSAPSLSTQYATCDASGNRDGGSSSMWIVPSDPHVNFVYVDPSEIGVGGYMDADSLMPENVIRCTQASNGTYHSNEAPTIVLAYWGDERGLSYVLQEDSIVHPAHEYQHLINIVHHTILQPQLQFEDPLLNEGLSMLAQDFAIDTATGGAEPLDGENILRTSGYLAAPQDYSVAGFAGVSAPGQTPLFNCATCYSPAWLLERYMFDHFGGEAYVQSMESGTQTSWPEVQAVTGATPQSILYDFAVAVGASNTAAATSSYSFTSVNLHTTYVDQLGDTYTLSGPAPIITLSGSGPQTFDILSGASAYFAVPPSASSGSASLSSGSNGSFDLSGYVLDY